MGSAFLRGSVQNSVDEFIAIGRAELFGQLHCLCQRHSVRQFGLRGQFVQGQPQYRVYFRLLPDSRSDRNVDVISIQRFPGRFHLERPFFFAKGEFPCQTQHITH